MTRMNGRRLVMLLMLVGILALMGCDGGADPADRPPDQPVEEPAKEPTEAPIEEPPEEPAEEPPEEATALPVEEPTAEPPTEEPTAQPTEVIEETPASQVKPVTLSELSSDARTQLSYVSGGAGYTYHYGQAEECLLAENNGFSLTIGGVFSTREKYTNMPWWGTKESPCKDRLEFGDMIYLIAQGFPMDEAITFTISGPLGDEEGYGVVESVLKLDGFSEEEYPAARYTWIPSPASGAGEYMVTASGSSGAVSMPVVIHENLGPNFGVKFGADEFHPLLLTPGEKIQMVLSGFPPNHVASVVLYKSHSLVTNLDIEPNHNLPEGEDEPIATLEVQMNDQGYALAELEWPSDLPSGQYSFLVPELIRAEPHESEDGFPYEPQYGPALYSTQFAYGGPGATWCIFYCGRENEIVEEEEPVNGWTVSEVLFEESEGGPVGSFSQIDDLTWIETNSGGEYVYQEVGRDEWSVYLYDESRNISIQLDLWLGEIIYSDENTAFTLYYVMEAR